MLLSCADSTMVSSCLWHHNDIIYIQVLQTGQEITELDSSGFATQSPTVFAGNIGPYIVQATHTDVRLLKGGVVSNISE